MLQLIEVGKTIVKLIERVRGIIQEIIISLTTFPLKFLKVMTN